MFETHGDNPRSQADEPAAAGGEQKVACSHECDCERLIGELREAVRARDDFISIAAHELRNPITPIQLCVRLIRIAEESGNYTKVAAELGRLERLLERFLRRTEVLLDMTKLVSGKLNLELARVNLSELAGSALDGLRPLVARSGSELIVVIVPDIMGEVDATAFGQVIDNLLSNAIKYGRGKPIELYLDVIDHNARLTVRDNGEGIGSADQQRIFEPFERAVKKTDKPGFGLGLWVSRRMIEAMSGTITVSSEEGAGSIFVVTIPLEPRKTDG
jgi:two-component system OmpR family sensor kinase